MQASLRCGPNLPVQSHILLPFSKSLSYTPLTTDCSDSALIYTSPPSFHMFLPNFPV